MRWLYLLPELPDEAARREELLRLIDNWWARFAEAAPTIARSFKRECSFNLPKFMHQHLHAIDDRLMWEFGPAIAGNGDRLVITPECDHMLRPMVEVLLQRAPQLPGWEFYPYRLPDPYDFAMQTVQGRTKGDISGARVIVRRSPQNRVDLQFHHPGCAGPDDQQASKDAFVATESLLGEELLDRWISAIDVVPLKQKGIFGKLVAGVSAGPGIPLERLKETVDSLVGSIVERLPAAPLWVRRQQLDENEERWASFERNAPRDGEDYPKWTDLFVGVTCQLDLTSALLAPMAFDSATFSRAGELFCYLKIDGREGPGSFEDRGAIEDAVTAALAEQECGCIFGGGTGRIYSYVFLALTDVVKAAHAIRDALRAGHIPHRSWLLFFDARLADEWIGMYDDTPPPPAPPA